MIFRMDDFFVQTAISFIYFFGFFLTKYKIEYNIPFFVTISLSVIALLHERFCQLNSAKIYDYYSPEWIDFGVKIFYYYNLGSALIATVRLCYEYTGENKYLSKNRKKATTIMSLFSFLVFWLLGYAAGYEGLFQQITIGTLYVGMFVKNPHGSHGICNSIYCTISYWFIDKNISEQVKVLEKNVSADEEKNKTLCIKLKILKKKNKGIHYLQGKYDRSSEDLQKKRGELLELKAKEKRLDDTKTWIGFFMLIISHLCFICNVFKIFASFKGIAWDDEINMNDTVTNFINFLNKVVTIFRNEPLDREYWAKEFSYCFSRIIQMTTIFGSVQSYAKVFGFLQGNLTATLLFSNFVSIVNIFNQTKSVPKELQAKAIMGVFGNADYKKLYSFSNKCTALSLVVFLFYYFIRFCFSYFNCVRYYDEFFSRFFTLFWKALEIFCYVLITLTEKIEVWVLRLVNKLKHVRFTNIITSAARSVIFFLPSLKKICKGCTVEHFSF